MTSTGLLMFDSTEVTLTDRFGTKRSIPVRIAGSGQPIIFLHGFPLDGRMWEPVMARLLPKFRCIAPDLRGFGEAAEERTSFSLDDLAHDVAGLVRGLGIQQKVCLCGLSMGGYVAMRFVDLYPNLVSRVVLSNTRGNADDAEGAKTRIAAAAKAIKDSPQDVVGPMLPKLLYEKTAKVEPEMVGLVQDMIESARASSVAWAQLAMARRPNSLLQMKNWSLPVLIVAGEKDTIAPPEAAQAMHESIAGSKLLIDPGSAHMTPLETPDWFAKQVYELFSI